MLQSPNPRQTKVLLGTARVRTGPTPAFFAREPSSGPRDKWAARGDVEGALGGVEADVGDVGSPPGGVLSVFISREVRDAQRWRKVCLCLGLLRTWGVRLFTCKTQDTAWSSGTGP
jgi:hypothetical protein